jgi:hypothetical protein
MLSHPKEAEMSRHGLVSLVSLSVGAVIATGAWAEASAEDLDPDFPTYAAYTDKGPVCPLDFSPFVHETATPADLACRLDQDDDGLNDEVEGRVAECFVPAFKYDHHEGIDFDGKGHHTRRHLPECADGVRPPCLPGGSEPVALFNISPDAQGKSASIHWVFVYSWDGGFPEFKLDRNAHIGDTESMEMRVVFYQDHDRWFAKLTHVSANNSWTMGVDGKSYAEPCPDEGAFPLPPALVMTWGRYPICGAVQPLRVRDGTHPVLYPSALKHHTSLLPYASNEYSFFTFWSPLISFTPIEYRHTDWNRGDGNLFVPPVRSWRQREATFNPGFFQGWHNIGRLELAAGSYLPPGFGCQTKANAENALAGLCPPKQICDEGCYPEDYPCCLWPTTCCTALGCDVCRCPETIPASCKPDPYAPTHDQCEQMEASVQGFTPTDCGFGAALAGPVNVNHCEAHRNPNNPTVSALFVSDLDFMNLWGFGESLGSTLDFCGTDAAGSCPSGDGLAATPPGKLLEYLGPALGGDADSDGEVNSKDLCPNLPSAGSNDADGDGAGDACDPNPSWYDRWVAQGAPQSNRRAYHPASQIAPKWKLAGWLDTDGDGLINGADQCPSGPHKAKLEESNVNAWGEDEDFPPSSLTVNYGHYNDQGKADGEYLPTRAHRGFATRGDACDPYETAYVDYLTQWLAGGSKCSPAIDVGTDSIPLDLLPNRGRSPNEGVALAPGPKSVQVDIRRCGCTSGTLKECLDPNTGECPREMPFMHAQQGAGTTWLPVERAACAHQTTGLLAGFCAPYATSAPAFNSGPPETVHWDWVEEFQSDIAGTHFPPGWITTKTDQLSVPYKVADGVHFTIATETIVNDPGTGRPLVHPTHERKAGNEADISPTAPTPGQPAWSATEEDVRTQRLRTFFRDDKWFVPQQLHTTVNPNLGLCQYPTYIPNWIQLHFSKSGKPIFPPIDQTFRPTGWGIIESWSDADRTLLVSLDKGLLLPVRVATPLSSGVSLNSLRALGGAYALTATTAEADWFDVVPFGAWSQDDLSIPPRLLFVARVVSGSLGWWLLGPSPSSVADDGVTFEVISTGQAPLELAGIKLQPDNSGAHVVGYREADSEAGGRRLHVFDANTLAWTSTPVAQDDLRNEAQWVVHGGYVFRTGGRDAAGALRGDLVRIDLWSGELSAIPGAAGDALPARSNPVLAWDVGAEGLILAGGLDQAGVAHSDIWSLRAGLPRAERLAADGPAERVPAIAPGALVLANGSTRTAQVIAAQSSGAEPFSRWIIKDDGWEALELTTGATATAWCADDREPEACFSTGAAWWATAGDRCASEPCVMKTSTETAVTTTLPGQGVRDIGLAGGMAWIARDSSVEAWDVSNPGTPHLRATVPFDSQVRAIVSDPTGLDAAVGTDAGFVRIMRLGESYAAGAPVPLTGRPISIVPFDGKRWLVMTSTGATLLDDDGAGGAQVRGKLKLPGANPPRPGKAAALNNGRFLVVTKDSLHRLRVRDTAVETVDSIELPGEAQALKVVGHTVYVVGKRSDGSHDVKVRLGEHLELDGKHSMRAWVLRLDQGLTRVRQTGSVGAGTAEVAWVR